MFYNIQLTLNRSFCKKDLLQKDLCRLDALQGNIPQGTR